jgi:phosphonate transport system substrate-binding protein
MQNFVQRALLVFGLLLGTAAWAQQPCPNRGELDSGYCDANRDLVADAPAQTVNPERLVLGFAQVEDFLTAQKTYLPLVDYLKTCTKKEVFMYPQVGEVNILEAMRTGRVHIGQFATGNAMFAVNFAGAVPFAAKGLSSTGRPDGYTLMLIVRADSAARVPPDLVGKTIAHTSASSNSGNLAPRALFPELGLTPEKDYKVVFSGKHERSITGVQLGLYDAAAVASDVYDRMIARGEIKRNQFRVVYESEPFPPDPFTLSHQLAPALAAQVRKCFMDFKFPDLMTRQLEGNDRFFPLSYERDWRLVRLIAKASGTRIDKAAYGQLISGKK